MNDQQMTIHNLIPQQFETESLPERQKFQDASLWFCGFPEDEDSQLTVSHQHSHLLPEALVTASVGRKVEFISGRLSAKSALRQLGVADVQIHSNSDRSPSWPEGIRGSITHKKSLAAAAVSAQLDFVGIDLETIMPEKGAHKLSRKIVDETEKQLLLDSNIPFAEAFTRVFSAKEALYKAIYPDIKRYLGFSVCQVTAMEKDKLTLTLQPKLQDELQHHRPFLIYSYPLNTQILSVLLDNR